MPGVDDRKAVGHGIDRRVVINIAGNNDIRVFPLRVFDHAFSGAAGNRRPADHAVRISVAEHIGNAESPFYVPAERRERSLPGERADAADSLRLSPALSRHQKDLRVLQAELFLVQIRHLPHIKIRVRREVSDVMLRHREQPSAHAVFVRHAADR